MDGEQTSLPGMPGPQALKKAEQALDIADRIEEERQRNLWTDALACARDVALACLPRSPTKEKEIKKTITYAPGCEVTVTYSVTGSAQMPYGSDRYVLLGLQHLARKQNNPHIKFEKAGELLDLFGYEDGGKEYRLLRERFDRLKSLNIEIETKGSAVLNSRTKVGLGTRLIEEWAIPTRSEIKAEQAGQTSLLPVEDPPHYVRISESLFRRLQKGSDDENILLLRLDLLKLFKKNPRGWDFCVFLCHRCGSAKRTSVVPHSFLMEFFKNGKSEPDRVTIAALKVIHEEIMRATGGALKSEFIEVGQVTKGRGRPKKQWGLQVRPSKTIILDGSKKFKV